MPTLKLNGSDNDNDEYRTVNGNVNGSAQDVYKRQQSYNKRYLGLGLQFILQILYLFYFIALGSQNFEISITFY